LFRDAHFAVDVPYFRGQEGDAVALAFRVADAENYYHFAIDGSAFIFSVRAPGLEREALIPWTETAAIVAGGPNRLEATVIGPRITLYVNGQKVGEVEDSTVTGGGLAMSAYLEGVGDSVQVGFDNLQVLVPPSQWAVPTPPAPGPTPAGRAVTQGQKWECLVCGYVYDPAEGDPTLDIPPGTRFEDLPDDWTCPDGEATKDLFEPLQ